MSSPVLSAINSDHGRHRSSSSHPHRHHHRGEPAGFRRRAGWWLAQSGGLLLCASVIAGLWMFGSTRPAGTRAGLRLLAAGLLTASALGLCGCRLAQLPCPVPGWLLWLAAAGLAAGWYHVLAGPAVEPALFTRIHLARLMARWPKSMVERTPWVLAAQTTGLFGGFLLASSLAANRAWRRTLAATIVLGTASIALLGLWQNYRQYTTILGERPGGMTGYFFGTLFHHTSAGAMINLGWPLAVTLGVWSLVGGTGSRLHKGLAALPWLAALAVLLAGHLGHISRMPQLLAALGGGALLLVLLPRLARHGLRRTLSALIFAGLLLALAIGWLSYHTERLGQIGERWSLLFHGAPAAAPRPDWPPPESEWSRMLPDDLAIPLGPGQGDRPLGRAAALRLSLQAGPLGFGPGAWTAAASHVFTEPFMRTFFLWVEFTHLDFLEWGWIAGAALALLVGGGLRRALRQVRHVATTSYPLDGDAALALGSALSLLVVGLQSLMDFPLQFASLQALFMLHLALCWSLPPPPLPSS